jgi:PAS domain S-box-containing protein
MSKRKPRDHAGASRRLAVAFSLFAIAISIVLTLSIRDKRSADRGREAQAALSRIEVQVQEVHSLEWLATAAQEITPEAETRLSSSKGGLLTTASSLQLQAQESLTEQFGPAVRSFVEATDRQLQLIQHGNFEEARRLDFEEVSQQFDILQHRLHQAGDGEARLAEAAAARSRLEFASAVLLGTLSIVILFLRFQRQRQLMLARQAVLQQSEERFRALTEKSADLVFITDSAGTVNYVSPSIRTVLSFDGDVINGRNLIDFVPPGDVPKLKSSIGIAEGESETVEIRFRHKDGRWLDFECAVRNLLNLENINGVVVNAREITERKKAESQLLFNASHDQLTGLPNRLLFLNRLQTVVDRIKRHPEQMAAVLFVMSMTLRL